MKQLWLRILVAGTVALACVATMASWSAPITPDVWFWFGACLLSERLWVRMPLGGATVSMASAAQFAALLVLPQGHAMGAAAISTLLAELLFMRKPLIRALFNGAHAALTVGAAAWVIALLGTGLPGSSIASLLWTLATLVLGACVYFVVNTGAVSIAVACNEAMSPLRAWRGNFGTRYELLSNGALFSLGAVFAGLYALTGPAATLLIVAPLWVAYQGYQQHVHRRGGAAESQERQAA